MLFALVRFVSIILLTFFGLLLFLESFQRSRDGYSWFWQRLLGAALLFAAWQIYLIR